MNATAADCENGEFTIVVKYRTLKCFSDTYRCVTVIYMLIKLILIELN